MNSKVIAIVAAALSLAGCCTCKCPMKNCAYGNWGLKLPYDDMNAGHMILSRNADGSPEALVLWRWASPIPMMDVKVEGAKFSFVHPWGNLKVEGEVSGKDLCAKLYEPKDGDFKFVGDITGNRNPPVCPYANVKDAQFGEKIDLLANGLDGWKSMNEKAKFGWKMKEENGEKILSNELGLKPDGSWAGGGANLMSVRNDFYDFKLEYDVRVPKNSNSGVYLRGRYEIQVIDSYGKPVDCHNMAAYYGRVTPSAAVEKKPGEWQHVSVVLYKRHLTVVLNGTTIIENAPVVGITGGAIDANEFVKGPIYLQGDHSDADYKNMFLYPAK